MVAAEIGYLGLLKREFQKLLLEGKRDKTAEQSAKLPREADTRGVSCYLSSPRNTSNYVQLVAMEKMAHVRV